MAGKMRGAVCGLLAGLFGWVTCAASPAQDVAGRLEVVPAGQPMAVAGQDRPATTYTPLQAGQDAQRMAEQQRLHAIDRQVELVQGAWQRQAWAVPYAAVVPQVHVYAAPRAYRRAYRRGYVPVPQPLPYASVSVYAHPYSVWVGQPIGYQQLWVGSGGYVYRPYYGQPAQPQGVPTPASPSTEARQPSRAAAPSERSSGPALSAPVRPTPEAIPAPPAEPTPGGP